MKGIIPAERGFLVFEVPAEQTVVGAITQRKPGCTVDLVGRPLIRDEGHAYLLHYITRGIDAATRQEVLLMMDSVYEDVETLRWSEEELYWEVRGIIPVENIHSRGLRFVAGLFGLADAPWVLFKDGKASVRLYPKEAVLMPRLAEAVDARLTAMGLPSHPKIEAMDLSLYRERAHAVGIAITP